MKLCRARAMNLEKTHFRFFLTILLQHDFKKNLFKICFFNETRLAESNEQYVLRKVL